MKKEHIVYLYKKGSGVVTYAKELFDKVGENYVLKSGFRYATEKEIESHYSVELIEEKPEPKKEKKVKSKNKKVVESETLPVEPEVKKEVEEVIE